MRGRVVATLVLAAGAVSCAKIAPPPGGPEDRDAPQISDLAPPRGAVSVSPDSALVLSFSEEVDRNSVMRGLTIHPPVDFRRSEWEGAQLQLVPEQGWPTDRPVLVLLAGTAKDRRGNELGAPFRTRFWTADVRDSAEISGRVWPGREVGRAGAPLVAAYRAGAPGDTLDPVRSSPVAVDDVQKAGDFRLTGLDPAYRYHIVAMTDPSGDAVPDGRGEFWQEAPALANFDDADSTGTFIVPDFLLGTLDSLGSIRGEIEADSGAAAFVWAESRTDSAAADTARVTNSMSVPAGGPFRLEVPTGFTYRLLAFLDTDGDSLPGDADKVVEQDEPVPLVFTAEQSGYRFDLTGLLPAPADGAAESGSAAPDSLTESGATEDGAP